jgi:hypothetical protein
MDIPDLSSAPLFTDVLSSTSEALADLSDPELLWLSSWGLGDRDLLLAGLGDREPEMENTFQPKIFQHMDYIMMLSVIQTIHCQLVAWLVNNELETIWKKSIIFWDMTPCSLVKV